MINKEYNKINVDPVREQALKILFKVFEKKAYSSILIKNIGQKYTALDRAFISEMVYGTIKYRLRIDYIISNMSKIKIDKISPYIMNILRLGIYQIDFMDRVPDSAAVDECVKLAKKYGNIVASKFVNGMLRGYIREHDNIKYPDRNKETIEYLSAFYSYPQWIVQRLADEYDLGFTEDFLKNSNRVPNVTVRVNNLKTDKESLKQSLANRGINVDNGYYMDDALILKGIPGIEYMQEYTDGCMTVQDESSMLAASIVDPKPGEFILDVCSAPGTKSTYMAEMMKNQGKITCGDISSEKLKLVSQNADRLGIKIINTIVNDASEITDSFLGKADRVLIDAPCSGLGILRKKPEIRWNRKAIDIENLSSLQGRILDASSRYVSLGGILVYSTCTVLKEENLFVLQNFLKHNSNFAPEDITEIMPDELKRESCKNGYIELFPNSDNIDGFFIARMKRVK